MPYEHILFVEGPDDRHALFHLLKRHGIDVCFFDVEEIDLISGVIAIKPLGGYPELRRRLPRELQISSRLLRAGIVVDANDDVSDRWDSLRTRIVESGGEELPPALSPDGWVGIVRLADRSPVVGAWLMPDNQNPGALEEFAQRLMPPDDPLWEYAGHCIGSLPERRFAESHLNKARVHTWLAWQEEPGKPIGQAITKGFLNPQAQTARNFVAWVRRLFSV